MGITSGTPDSDIQPIIDEILEEVLTISRPRFCYTITPTIDFKCGKIIADALELGQRYALVISTAGEELDSLINSYQQSDIVKAFVANSIGSEMAEAISRHAISIIEESLNDTEKISNSYSPGYCGWALTEQRKLFSYFEPQPCGVDLTDSCLMLPIKSISAVLAIGERVIKAPYGCEICTKSDCYKKRKI